jgi:hypothetical protein
MKFKTLADRLLRVCAAGLLALAAVPALADDAAALQSRYTELREQLRSNPYGRPMFVESAEAAHSIRGEVYAVLDHPFSKVSQAMKDPAQWCEIMLLPFNTKYCHAQDTARLTMRIGRKYDQPAEQAYRLDFTFRNVAASPDFYESRLTAAEGPVGTRDYRITVSAIPLDDGRTFMHLGYSYGYGSAGRFAMQVYLATAGADKVGFSYSGKDGNGKPLYIGGVRGAIERNVMRYYLAIDSYLDTVDAPPAQRVDKRINEWFAATEHYARQLHEMDRSTYVSMKKQEYERAGSLALQ